jgi:transposase
MDKRFYIGVDVHRKRWTVSIVHQGECLSTHRQPPSLFALVEATRRAGATPRTARFVYEIGPTGFGLYDGLSRLGYQAIVVSPTHVPRSPGNRVKTDRRDSQDLAVKHSAGLFHGIHVPSPEERAVRDLVRTRRQLIGSRTRMIRRVKAELLFLNVPYPDERWSSTFRDFVLTLELPEENRWAIRHIVAVIDAAAREIRGCDLELGKVFEQPALHARLLLLQSIPEIGARSARSILAEMGDVERFPTAQNFASWLGLTPAEYSSGESVRRGRITHQGNAHIRSVLTEAAWTAIRRDPRLRRRYSTLARRIGPKKAVIATARKLAIIIYSMLQTGELYRSEAE